MSQRVPVRRDPEALKLRCLIGPVVALQQASACLNARMRRPSAVQIERDGLVHETRVSELLGSTFQGGRITRLRCLFPHDDDLCGPVWGRKYSEGLQGGVITALGASQ